MKCLFLTSSPGYGHTRAAEAIEQVLQQRHPDIETKYLNITSLIDEKVSEAVQDGYLRMTAEQPDLYQKLYDLDKHFYRQLAGEIPADKSLIDFLDEQQRHSFPEVVQRSRFALPVAQKNLDSALFNTLINSICNRDKIPAGRLLTKSLLGLIYSIMSFRLKKFINAYAPDVLIATQMYPNALLSHSIQKGLITQPVIGVLTDYGVHGVWVRSTTDVYCVSHADAAEALHKQGVTANRIKVTGIPLMPLFADTPSQPHARAQLGLDQSPTVLITGGQCGIGVVDAAQQLLQDDRFHYQVLVTEGSNTADMAALRELESQYQNRFRLYTWRADISHLICAADIVIGKPGGLTVSETLACGRPFIATCCLGGQEAHNVQFLQENKAGLRLELKQLPTVLSELFGNPELLCAMKKSAYRAGRPNAALAVVQELENIMQHKNLIPPKRVSVGEL